MSKINVNLSIPFNDLLKAITKLEYKEKFKIWKLLDEQFEKVEELEQNPEIVSQVKEARVAYKKGEFVGLKDYISKEKNKMKNIQLEASIVKRDNKIWIKLPDDMKELVNHRVKVSINQLSDMATSVKEVFNLVASKTDKLPEDYSTNFEHYLFGNLKRENEV
jgi:hypothetical protein